VIRRNERKLLPVHCLTNHIHKLEVVGGTLSRLHTTATDACLSSATQGLLRCSFAGLLLHNQHHRNTKGGSKRIRFQTPPRLTAVHFGCTGT
jgi:hypothetical protein